MVKKWIAVLVCSIGSFLISADTQAADVIREGVYIDGIDIGGLTKQAAKQTEEEYLQKLSETAVTVDVNGHAVRTSLAGLGYHAEETYAKKAAKLGKEGNLIERYMEIADAEQKALVYEHTFSFDEERLEAFVSEECAAYNIEAVNATIHQDKDGNARITKSESGSVIVENETIEKIKRTILEDWDKSSAIVIPAILVEDMPAFTAETAKDCTELLGSFTTSYQNSNANRCENLSNAAQLINGSFLYPGQEFSVYKALYPITEENGFKSAGSYADGKVVESIGGGVCQASTTLYNAALAAELEITQRNPHSMVVGYVEPGMDAAIAGTYKDLKFVNNLNTPVYIEAVTEKKTITFRIWGKEIREKNRTIRYVPEILETLKPGEDVVTFDPDIQAGNGYIAQDSHQGYKVNLYKVVSVDGEEDERELVSYSEYAASPRYVVAGTKGKKKDDSGGQEKEDSVDGLEEAAES